MGSLFSRTTPCYESKRKLSHAEDSAGECVKRLRLDATIDRYDREAWADESPSCYHADETCAGCGVEGDEDFTLCDLCHRWSYRTDMMYRRDRVRRDPPEPTSIIPYEPAKHCAVCSFEDNDAQIRCTKCSRLYHVNCHYPKITIDLCMLVGWECRLCCVWDDVFTYGDRSSNSFEKRPLCERLLLHLSVNPRFRRYFGKLDGMKINLSEGGYCHELDVLKSVRQILREKRCDVEKRAVAKTSMKDASDMILSSYL